MSAGRDSLGEARPLTFPATLSTSGKTYEHRAAGYVGRVFTYENTAWTVTSATVGKEGHSEHLTRFWIVTNPDGSGERREVSMDELEAMLRG